MTDNLREKLAALEHEQWAHLTKYMLDILKPLLVPDARDFFTDETTPMRHVSRWLRQIETPYDQLTEEEKESDREWADKVFELLKADADFRKWRNKAYPRYIVEES